MDPHVIESHLTSPSYACSFCLRGGGRQSPERLRLAYMTEGGAAMLLRGGREAEGGMANRGSDRTRQGRRMSMVALAMVVEADVHGKGGKQT